MAVRDMREKVTRRTTAVTNVDLAGVFTAPTNVKILPVRRGGCPRAPAEARPKRVQLISVSLRFTGLSKLRR